MKIEQLYTGCLAQGAYYIESEGDVAIIDPLREVQQYIDKASEERSKIKYIFETHFHADFVSGHVTLSEKTGAPIIYGPTAKTTFDAIIAEDGQSFKLGKIELVALHTPGHTMESTTYLLKDESGKDVAIFTGDTLFLGDVGRPDLAQKSNDISQEELAGTLFDSLRNKIMPLADDIMVYPAHGAGSACGKNMSSETMGKLGEQKRTNYALRLDMTREEFIEEVLDGLKPPPAYFPMNVQLNKMGYDAVDEIISRGEHALSPEEFVELADSTEAVVIDVRTKDEFATAHVPGSIFIGLDGSFAPWVGELVVDVKTPLLLVCNDSQLKEALTRLSRVGFDNTLGYLKGGVEAYQRDGFEVDHVVQIDADELASHYVESKFGKIIDVRKESEFDSEKIEGAQNYPLRLLGNSWKTLPATEPLTIHCRSGYRSLIAASILKSRGIHQIIDVKGGMSEMKKTNLPIETAITLS